MLSSILRIAVPLRVDLERAQNKKVLKKKKKHYLASNTQ